MSIYTVHTSSGCMLVEAEHVTVDRRGSLVFSARGPIGQKNPFLTFAGGCWKAFHRADRYQLWYSEGYHTISESRVARLVSSVPEGPVS